MMVLTGRVRGHAQRERKTVGGCSRGSRRCLFVVVGGCSSPATLMVVAAVERVFGEIGRVHFDYVTVHSLTGDRG